MLDIPTHSEPGPSIPCKSDGAKTDGGSSQRRFTSAFLFPSYRPSSPMFSLSMFHSSAPTSPIPPCTPSPSHSPCLSPLPSLYAFFRDQSPSPGPSRTPSPSTRDQISPPRTMSPIATSGNIAYDRVHVYFTFTLLSRKCGNNYSTSNAEFFTASYICMQQH